MGKQRQDDARAVCASVPGFHCGFAGKTLYAQDLRAGADAEFGIRTRVFTELAWHSLFIRTLLLRPNRSELATFVPELTIYCCPTFKADPKRHGVRSDTVIAIDFTKKIVLIGGSSYAGEIKKAVFTTMNYFLPAQAVMPMHCSANVGPKGDAAIFFGLSGTGKTTLSADPGRTLVGDDEHGWGPQRHLQFRGRMLCQGDQVECRGRAGDICHHAALRNRAGERRIRSGHPCLRLRRWLKDGKYARGLSDAFHPQCFKKRARRTPEKPRHADRRRVRGDAADRQADGGGSHVSFSVGIYRQGCRNRKGRDRTARPPSRPASGRRSCPVIPRSTATCCAR